MSARPERVPWYLSIATRVLLGTVALLALIVGAVLWQWAQSARQLVVEQTREEAAAVAETLALDLVPFVADENWAQARVVMDILGQRNKSFVYIILNDDRTPRIALAVPSSQESRFISDLVPLAVSKRANENGDARVADTFLLHDLPYADRIAKRGDRIIEVAADVRFTGQRYGTIRVGVSLRKAEERITGIRDRALLGVAICFVVALLGAWWLARSITGPVIALAELMDRVGAGELDTEAQVKGRHELAHLSQAFNDMLMGLRHKRVLEKYVPMGARRDISKDSHGRLELGGRRLRAAIMFSDLRGFTSLSERLTPQEVVAILNEYLQDMNVCIADVGGDVNEYIGDAILAVFECDQGQNGALAAVRAGWAMQAALKKLKESTTNEEVRRLVMGIGIHVGDIVEGNIGSRDRVKYGVVGDTVNLAARIQDRSRDGTCTCIFVSDAVKKELGDAFESLSLGEMTFKGKSKPVAVWEIKEKLEADVPRPSILPRSRRPT